MQGRQPVQQPVRDGGQQVVMETEVRSPGGESGGEGRGGERPAAAVHLTARTRAKVGTR